MDRTYCVFGDSIVQAAYIKNSWVDFLKNYLEEKHVEDFINVFNLGIGGNTTDDVLSRLENEAKFRGPTSLIFGVGINDSGYFRFPEKPIVEKERFISNLENIIKISKKFTNDIIFTGLVLGDDSLLQPFPGSSQGKSYTTERTIGYDKLIKEIAEKNNCKYIYLFDKLGFEDFSDGLHPNESGHKKIFEVIIKNEIL